MDNSSRKLILEYWQNGRIWLERLSKRLLGYANAEVETGQATEFHVNLFPINAHSRQSS
jgi:hypothetical protein